MDAHSTFDIILRHNKLGVGQTGHFQFLGTCTFHTCLTHSSYQLKCSLPHITDGLGRAAFGHRLGETYSLAPVSMLRLWKQFLSQPSVYSVWNLRYTPLTLITICLQAKRYRQSSENRLIQNHAHKEA